MATLTRTTRRGFLARAAALGTAGAAIPEILSSGTLDAAAASSAGPWQIGIYTRPFGQFEYRVFCEWIVALELLLVHGYEFVCGERFDCDRVHFSEEIVVAKRLLLQKQEKVRFCAGVCHDASPEFLYLI